MRAVSVLAQKGGAGKTTLVLHWAVEAARKKQDRVAVIDTDSQGSAVAWALRRKQERPLVLQADGDTLRQAVQACELDGIGLVLIDTMPRAEKPNVEAARLADLVVIPCGPSVVDIEAIGSTIEIVHQVGVPGVIVVTQGRPGSPINKKAMAVLEQYGLPVCPVIIMRRAALADALTDGRAVVELAPESKGTREISRSWKWITTHL